MPQRNVMAPLTRTGRPCRSAGVPGVRRSSVDPGQSRAPCRRRPQPHQPAAGKQLDLAHPQRRQPGPSGRQLVRAAGSGCAAASSRPPRPSRRCPPRVPGRPMRARIGAATRAQPVQRAVVLLAQMGLGEPGHRRRPARRRRMHGRRRARDVHDADDLSRSRIPDRRPRACPRVVTAQEMLGGEHLHGAVATPTRCRWRWCRQRPRPSARPRRTRAGRRCAAPTASRSATAPGPSRRPRQGC